MCDDVVWRGAVLRHLEEEEPKARDFLDEQIVQFVQKS